MKRSRVLLALLCLSAAASWGADWPPNEPEAVRSAPVQHNGRVKPFDTYAREALWQITGRPQFEQEDPVRTVLSIMHEPDRWQEVPLLEVPFVPLREALEMDPKARRVSYSDLLSTRKLMRMLPAIVEKQGRGEKLTMLENETMDLFNRFVTFSDLIARKVQRVPESEVQPWRMRWEVAYNRFAPFRLARWLYLFAALLLLAVLAKPRRGVEAYAMGLVAAAFLFHGIGISLRVILGGRPPVSNFYETMLWIPFVAVALGLLFYKIYRAYAVTLSAALLAVVMLLLSEWVPLDSGITPVVAVLRSNLWLSIHVLTIVASYGALGVAGVLAHVYAVRYLATAGKDPQLSALELLLYRVIQVGVVLLASGIMLGGVWANASWGRYWGWDPKETWALITLLWFLAMLHGRFAGWLRGIRLALSTIGGLFLVLMTYYGVSFYLVGLHSYAGGNAKPLPPLLVAYLVAELVFIFSVVILYKRK